MLVNDVVTKEHKDGVLIYFLKEGECQVKKMVKLDTKKNNNLNNDKNNEDNTTKNLNKFEVKKDISMHNIPFCTIQQGATIGEECLLPEGKYFYTVTIMSPKANLFVLRKNIAFSELESLQIIDYLQKKFLQKK